MVPCIIVHSKIMKCVVSSAILIEVPTYGARVTANLVSCSARSLPNKNARRGLNTGP